MSELLDFGKQDGLIAAVVQDANTQRVLMVGYMSREALDKTMATGNVTFFSRSRQKLWTKGESSGHVLKLKSMSVDCDGDALLVQAEPVGPGVCHAGYESCFYRTWKDGEWLVSDELACRSKRLLERRHKQAQFRDPNKQLDNFDFQFNPKMNRSLVFDLATAAWIGRREDALFLGPAGSGKSHCAQAIGHAVIQQGYRVLYREAHLLLEELADATLDGNRKEHMELLTTVPLLIIDDMGMRRLPLTAAEELLEIIMRRYERASTLITSNRPVEDWGKLLGDSAAVSAMLDRLLHHGHVLKCGPRSWRTRIGSQGESQ